MHQYIKILSVCVCLCVCVTEVGSSGAGLHSRGAAAKANTIREQQVEADAIREQQLKQMHRGAAAEEDASGSSKLKRTQLGCSSV